jgi:hypothetical protein
MKLSNEKERIDEMTRSVFLKWVAGNLNCDSKFVNRREQQKKVYWTNQLRYFV